MPSRNRKKRTKQRAEYLQKQEENKAKARERYRADPEKKKASVRESYKADPEKKKASVRESYKADPEKKKASIRESYNADPEKKKASIVRDVLKKGLYNEYNHQDTNSATCWLPSFYFDYLFRVVQQPHREGHSNNVVPAIKVVAFLEVVFLWSRNALGSHLSLLSILRIIHLWSTKTPVGKTISEVQVTDHTAVDWYNFIRDICAQYFVDHPTVIGGPGTEVEIDESKFGRRKYNRGRIVDGHWVFGGMERLTGECFLVEVEHRDAATLLPLIQQYIRPGSVVYSDEWSAYNQLATVAGCNHQTVNHSLHFVDPNTRLQPLEENRAAKRQRYGEDLEENRAAKRQRYGEDLEENRAVKRQRYQESVEENRAAKRRIINSDIQGYSLFEPNSRTLAEYGVSLEKAILRDSELLSDVNNAFCNSHPLLAQKVVTRSARAAVSKISADALLAKAISVLRSQAGSLLKTIRKVNAKKLQESDILVGHRFHTAGAEPYFFDNSYTHRKQHGAIPVDLNGRCVVAEEIKDRDKVTMCPLKWKCTNECRKLTSEEVAIVLKTNSLFQKSIEDLRAGLDALDSGCGHVHYDVTLKSRSGFIDQLGHPIYCELPECSSPLRVIRAAMPHYPALRTFTRLLYKARKCHMTILAIDSALASGNIDELIPFMGMKDNLSDLFSEDGVEHAVVSEDHLSSGLGCIERDLKVTHADLIAELQSKFNDDAEFACCSCERLFQRKQVSCVNFSLDKYETDTWQRLKAHVLQNGVTEQLYICQYCRPFLNKNTIPARCVLNGLVTELIPDELKSLNALSKQLIQRAKAFQTIVRLGTYSSKVPAYNALQACRGCMFFLPLPLNKTWDTLSEIELGGSGLVALPDPQLYIIVNGVPTKDKIVWQTLVDVNAVKLAIQQLKEINWLYKNVDDASLDEAAKNIVEVVDQASSIMLEKASTDDVAALQAYTIRSLDQQGSTKLDVEQYKMQNVKDSPIESRQRHLDVMCFPTLFPSGQFGEFHPRDIHLSASEYAKSRLLNKDSRFRKDPQYVFFLLWQQEMRQISAGIYNVLKTTSKGKVPVREFLSRVSNSDELVEANLSTIFQSVRGTKQYWFHKRSVLGVVLHFFWKKEYQARGAPHYHVLLWIQDAPVIGKSDPKDVLAWIQERITCKIPDAALNPELHALVTKYQMRKCTNYCKRRQKLKSGFITKCRFSFPRDVTEHAVLNPVEECLKSRKKIYLLPRAAQECRGNDYNPLLLLLWQANMDIQFTAESSLTLAHYVTGYVTKAEKSNMQEVWQEVNSNSSIYSKLWSFGVRSLRSRECGLYEASDLLLGDHLTEKSVTVKWVDASMPHKRKRRLKTHKQLVEVEKMNPASTDILEGSMVDIFYPTRPNELENVCLYDFVQWYKYCGTDKDGSRVYQKLQKPLLPNHKLFDPSNENQREDYFYSLMLLFIPFRNECGLMKEGETAEVAFNRLIGSNVSLSDHHEKLQALLKAQTAVKKINEAREEEGVVVPPAEEDAYFGGEAKAAMEDVFNLNEVNAAETVEERVAKLNADQLRIFNDINDHLCHQKLHENENTSWSASVSI
ncbi:hypothetical protein EMCRGX_G006706 [Ephydatia muelleri]